MSAKRMDDRSGAPGAAVRWSSRRQTAGTQLRRVARWRSTAAPISSAVAERTNTTASRACHCCSAIVHAPMWNRGYGHTIAPRGSRSAPGKDRSTLARCDSTAPLGVPDEPLV